MKGAMQSVSVVGEISSEMLPKFLKKFRKLDALGEPFAVYITSEGGSLDAGQAIYDTIRTAQSHITTIGVGVVASIAVLVLTAGDHRTITEGTTLLIHDGSVTQQGNLFQVHAHLQQYLRQHESYCQLIAAESRLGIDLVRDLASTESYLTAKEALDAGLIDEIKPYRARFKDGLR